MSLLLIYKLYFSMYIKLQITLLCKLQYFYLLAIAQLEIIYYNINNLIIDN